MQWQATAMKSGDDEKIEFLTAVPLDGQVEVWQLSNGLLNIKMQIKTLVQLVLVQFAYSWKDRLQYTSNTLFDYINYLMDRIWCVWPCKIIYWPVNLSDDLSYLYPFYCPKNRMERMISYVLVLYKCGKIEVAIQYTTML